jgi:hypothetical protein
MKTGIVFWSVTAALAGFLFGFDTVVIAGTEQTIQTLWSLRCTAWRWLQRSTGPSSARS